MSHPERQKMHDKVIYKHNHRLMRKMKGRLLTRSWISKDGKVIELLWIEGKINVCLSTSL